MYRSALNYKTAFLLAFSISFLLNLIFMIMFLYGRDAFMPPEGHEHARPAFSLVHTLLNFISNFIFTYLLYLLNFYLLRSERKRRFKWLLIIVLTLIFALLLSYLLTKLQLQFHEEKRFPGRFIMGALFRDSILAVFVILSSQMLFLSNKQQKVALENETLLTENMKTRYVALKNQVDPHFLFNSLNTLNSLIKIDVDKAQEYVQQLSSVFRYTLQNKEIITLNEELKFTHAYCHLMQIRYGDNLKFIYDIEERYYSYSIIPLSLQILVENAIKHNVVSNRQPLTITLSTSEGDTIKISNPVQMKKEDEKGEGIGLSNLAERYRLMWKKDIIIKENDGIFEVELPLLNLS